MAESSGEPLPDEAMAEKERQQRVQGALAELPPEQKDVVTLAYLEGLSHREISERLGIAEGTVNAQLAIGLMRCRQYLCAHGVARACIRGGASGSLGASMVSFMLSIVMAFAAAAIDAS